MANSVKNTRIQLKHDIATNWAKAENFIPLAGEVVIYDIDENNSIARFKIGDGITNINSLPFVSHHEVISYLPQELTEEQKAQARENIGAGTLQIQADYSQNDETAVDYIKNRTHYEIPEKWLQVEFTEPLINDVSTTMFVSNSYTWAVDKTYRIRVDGKEYVFEGMTSKGQLNAFGGSIVYYIGELYATFNPNMTWSDYPFSFVTADFTNIYIVFEDGTTNHTVELFEADSAIHHLDPKYIKDMYYEDTKKIDISGATYTIDITGSTTQIENPIPLELGQTWSSYRMPRESSVWNEYRTFEVKQADDGAFYIGDSSLTDNEGSPVIYLTSNELTVPNNMVTQGYSAFKFVCDSGYTTSNELKQIDPKYIKDMYYETNKEIEIIPETTHEWDTLGFEGVYILDPIDITENAIYKVYWDGTLYECTPYMPEEAPVLAIGNSMVGDAGTIHNNEPFFIIVFEGNTLVFAETTGSHTFNVIKNSFTTHHIPTKYIKDMYYEKEIIKDISNLTYEIRPTDSGNNAGNEIVHNLNIPFELGQTWNIVDYDNSILYENVEVQQSNDGVLYLGTPTVNDYPFYITNNTVIANYNWYNNVLYKGFFNLVGVTQGEVEIHQIDEKYLSILEPDNKVVFELDGIVDGNEYNDTAYQKLLGKHRVTIDNNITEEIVFIDSGEDYSVAQSENIYIGTINGGIYFEFLDDEEHSVKIEKVKNVVKEEYLPDGTLAQSNWNQNDETAPDYIKNRTHYEYTIYTLRTPVDINKILDDMGVRLTTEIKIIEGITFRVIVDGVVYDDVPIWSGCYYASGDIWGIGDCYTNRGSETWHSTNYGFCFTKYGTPFIQEKFPNGIESIEVYTTSKEIKHLDPKFIKDMYYEKEITKDISNLTYKIEPINYVHSLNIPFELGQIWNIVEYDGTIMYENVEVQQTEDGTLYLGSPDVANYPFFITANTTKVNSGWARNFLNASYFNIVGATRGEVEIHQIDEKYIPDTIARVLDKDDALELAIELELIEPTTDESGNVFTDENGALYSL